MKRIIVFLFCGRTFSAENWKEALTVAKTLQGIATGGDLEVVDNKQKTFRDLLLDQVGVPQHLITYIF